MDSRVLIKVFFIFMLIIYVRTIVVIFDYDVIMSYTRVLVLLDGRFSIILTLKLITFIDLIQ